MFVCCDRCVLSGRGLCDGLITRPEESYRLWRVVVCDQETSKMRRLKPATGLRKIQPQWIVTPRKQTTNIDSNYGRLQYMILLLKIPMRTRKNFFEVYKQFGHAPSKSFASPALRCADPVDPVDLTIIQ
jgi:hypothetical protein